MRRWFDSGRGHQFPTRAGSGRDRIDPHEHETARSMAPWGMDRASGDGPPLRLPVPAARRGGVPPDRGRDSAHHGPRPRARLGAPARRGARVSHRGGAGPLSHELSRAARTSSRGDRFPAPDPDPGGFLCRRAGGVRGGSLLEPLGRASPGPGRVQRGGGRVRNGAAAPALAEAAGAHRPASGRPDGLLERPDRQPAPLLPRDRPPALRGPGRRSPRH